MGTTNVKLRTMASVGALVLTTACGPAGPPVSGPPDDDPDRELFTEPAGDEYHLDCRKPGSEVLPC